jgi:hypothetical protein
MDTNPLKTGMATSEAWMSLAAILAPILYNMILVPLLKKLNMDPTSPDANLEMIKQAIMWGANAVVAHGYAQSRGTVKAAALAGSIVENGPIVEG